jgi:hypothetical protein
VLIMNYILSARIDGLMLSSMFMKELLIVDNLMLEVRTVKILAVNTHALSLDVVIGLLRCFPCLEKLYIKVRIIL